MFTNFFLYDLNTVVSNSYQNLRLRFFLINLPAVHLFLADAKCSGRRDCQIPVPDMDMDAISECPNDLNRYLQATYDCIPGLLLL